jgi:hypothetical protein
MGSLFPDAQWSISCIYSNPWDDVAVNVLTPAVDAPMQQDIALCSDSTLIYSACISPLATNSDIFSMTLVCGVIGYAATILTSASLTAYAAA